MLPSQPRLIDSRFSERPCLKKKCTVIEDYNMWPTHTHPRTHVHTYIHVHTHAHAHTHRNLKRLHELSLMWAIFLGIKIFMYLCHKL